MPVHSARRPIDRPLRTADPRQPSAHALRGADSANHMYRPIESFALALISPDIVACPHGGTEGGCESSRQVSGGHCADVNGGGTVCVADTPLAGGATLRCSSCCRRCQP